MGTRMKIYGWPITYVGIGLGAVGLWLHSGIDAGLMVGGAVLVVVGFLQVTLS